MFKLFNNLMSPVDNPGGGDTTNPLTASGLLDELMKDDEPEVIDLAPPTPPVKDDEEPIVDDKEDKDNEDDTKDDKEDELEELEKELAGPDEKQLELMTPARRKDILAAFPELFKKFPYLETAYYRDQKFTELFPTIKEAEAASQSLQEYNDLSNKLKVGDIESVVMNVKKDEKSFNRMVDNYLPTLAKVDPAAYHHIIGNLIKHTVREMFTEGTSKENDSLKNAATILHEFMFATTKWTPPTNLSQDTNPADAKGETDLSRREREFNERRFTTAQNDISGRVDNAIKATIDQHIDPNGQMTDFVKKAATANALSQVETLLGKDTRFRALLDRLWQNAADKDFSKNEMDKIKSACISKARTLLPSVIKAARQEALKGLSKRNKDNDTNDENEQPSRSRESAPQPRGPRADKSKPLPGESSVDFLMRD